MSLSISKHTFSKLSESESLTQLVGDRIYPISTKNATSFPFVLYKRSALTPAYTKDRYANGDSVTIEVIAASDNYSNSVEVIEAARKALEGKRGKYDDFIVTGAKLIAAVEDFIEENCIQRLTFEIETDSVE